MLVLAASAAGAAAKWETMTFTEDTVKGFEDLKQYCRAHEIAVNDVFWANHTEESEMKAGSTIYLPAHQADLLAIWQHIGAWQSQKPKPVKPLLAEKKPAEPVKPAQPQAVQSEPAKPVETPKVQSEPVKPVQTQSQNIDLEKMLAEMSKPAEPVKPVQPQKVQAEPVKPVQVQAAQSEPVKSAQTQKVAAAKTTPAQAISEMTKTAEPLKLKKRAPAPTPSRKQGSPAKAIAQAAKPDKILTAKQKTPQQEIPGLMDPIIILSPNGDPTNGPMRLIISGDKVEVVKLPQNAVKKPTPADINAPFTSSYSYLSYYNNAGRPSGGGNIYTNLNSLNGKMMWPVDGKISSPFGKWRGKHMHQGIDIPMPAGTPIRAARNGVVARTGNNSTMGFRGYGNFVMLDHGGNIRTFYAHCQRVAVVEGQRVMQGQIIGYVGSTGRSTANHLHFEVRVNEAKVNPVPYMAGNAQLASHK